MHGTTIKRILGASFDFTLRRKQIRLPKCRNALRIKTAEKVKRRTSFFFTKSYHSQSTIHRNHYLWLHVEDKL